MNGIHIGPAFIHFYALMYLVGITAAVWITRRRWRATGGDPSLVGDDVALWAVPAGIIGGRKLTTPADIPHHWWRVFAVWASGARWHRPPCWARGAASTTTTSWIPPGVCESGPLIGVDELLDFR